MHEPALLQSNKITRLDIKTRHVRFDFSESAVKTTGSTAYLQQKYFSYFAFLAAIKIAVAVHFWINEKEKVRANKHAESYDTHIAS